jgi:hypothetical protein
MNVERAKQFFGKAPRWRLGGAENIFKIAFHGWEIRAVACGQLCSFRHPFSKLDGGRGGYVDALAWVSLANARP